MLKGEMIRGTRRDFGKNEVPRYAEYGRGPDDKWYGRPPGFRGAPAGLAKHHVVEHGDGTITVSPSIEVQNHNEYWHGFLEAGVWRKI